MKTIQDLTSNLHLVKEQPKEQKTSTQSLAHLNQQEITTQTNPISEIIPLIEDLFKDFRAIWGDKWCTHLSNPEISVRAIEAWAKSLIDLTSKQISYGLNVCKTTCDYTPTIAQFRKAALGVMPAEQAWLCRDTDSLARTAYNRCDPYTMRQLSDKEARAKFIDAYELLADNLCRSEENK